MMIDPAPFLRQLFDRAVEVADPMRSLAGFLPEKPEGRLGRCLPVVPDGLVRVALR